MWFWYGKATLKIKVYALCEILVEPINIFCV